MHASCPAPGRTRSQLHACGPRGEAGHRLGEERGHQDLGQARASMSELRTAYDQRFTEPLSTQSLHHLKLQYLILSYLLSDLILYILNYIR